MKQTAVQWFFNELYSIRKTIPFEQQAYSILKAFEQAKAMEKEQIIDAIKLTIEKEYHEQTWANCRSRNHMAEQYYNETFKSE